MKLNPVELQILKIIENDLLEKNSDYSTLTNNEIANQMNVSVFSVRDKIGNLEKKKAIFRRTDFWDNNGKYHNRIIYTL